MGNAYKNTCKYCGAVGKHGSICSYYKTKLELIRKIQTMVRNYKEDVERRKLNESEN